MARRGERGPGVRRSGACAAAAKFTLVEVGKKSHPVIRALGQVKGKIARVLLFWIAFILWCSVTQQSVGLCAKLPSGVSCHEKLSG